MTRSIRRRLILSVSLALFAGAGALVLLQRTVVSDRMDELADAHLVQSAHVLHSLVVSELYEHVAATDTRNRDEPIVLSELKMHLAMYHYERSLAFQVSMTPPGILLRSAGAPAEPFSAPGATGVSTVTIDAVQWRVCTLTSPDGRAVVRVGERMDARDAAVRRFVVDTLRPMAIGIPVLLVLLWIGVGAGLRPLSRLAAEVQRRDPSRMDPIVADAVPAEVRPLANALNTLLAKLKTAFESERRFTADAAHELKTPLSGIRIQAEVALRAPDSTARDHALNQVVRGVDGAAHLVDQLLTLARLDPDVGLDTREDVDLRALLVRAVDAHRARALERGIALSTDIPDRVVLLGNETVLGLILRNLIDNALRYAGDGGRVRAAVRRVDSRILLRVDDDGPGIAESERADLARRFRRGQHQSIPGCGLGLSIVQRAAQLHGGELKLETSDLGGLSAQVVFPRAGGGQADR
ncbi:MAG: ATP-binding protein [Gammaproteobacteria bacterium]